MNIALIKTFGDNCFLKQFFGDYCFLKQKSDSVKFRWFPCQFVPGENIGGHFQNPNLRATGVIVRAIVNMPDYRFMVIGLDLTRLNRVC